MRPPRALGLIICRGLTVDPATRELGLVGVLRALRAPNWTDPVLPLSAFAVLQGGQGEGTMRLVGHRLDTEEEVYSQTRWFVASSEVEMLPYQMVMRRCIFPGPGRYQFALLFEGEELAEALLDVHPGNASS